MIEFKSIGRIAAALGLAAAASLSPAWAGIVAHAGGYEVSYTLNLSPGTSNLQDVSHVFIFETDGSQFSITQAADIAGQGVTSLVHQSAFAPTRSLIAGVGFGVPGVGDGEDHVYLVADDGFAGSIVGLRWSQVFPGDASGRVSHSAFAALLVAADAGDVAALDGLRRFAVEDAAAAWFATTGAFSVSEFTVVAPPIGGSVPTPGGAWLAGLGLSLLALQRRRRP